MVPKAPLVVASLAFLLYYAGYYTSKHKIEPFMYDYYLFSWWSYILFLDVVIFIRRKKFLVLNQGLPYLIVISCAFWCLFELINVRLENWFYVNIPIPIWIRYPGYLFAYATVIPGVYLTKEVLSEIIKKVRAQPLPAPRLYPPLAIYTGFALLALILLLPLYLFAFTWAFLALIMDGWNYAKGHPSFMGDFEKGEAAPFLTTLLAGVICGFLWEFWNWSAVSRWVYSVPYFERMKVFEMPLLGYLGFAVFALETISFVTFIKAAGMLDRLRIPACIVALAFSILSFSLIDRYTVFSSLTPIEEISFIAPGTRARLQQRGVETIYGIRDVTVLDEKEQALVMLMEVKGLGYQNVLKLKEAGITDVKSLARLTPEQLSGIIGEKNLRRANVYVRAARRLAKDVS